MDYLDLEVPRCRLNGMAKKSMPRSDDVYAQYRDLQTWDYVEEW